jgi:hypothetical protein
MIGAVLCFVSLFFVWEPAQSYSTLVYVTKPGAFGTTDSGLETQNQQIHSWNGFSTFGAGPLVELLILAYFVVALIGLRKPLDRRWQYVTGIVGLALLALNAIGLIGTPTFGHLLYIAGVAVMCVAGWRAWPIMQRAS